MDSQIRKATPSDYDDLCSLLAEADALHRKNLPHIYQEAAGPVRDKEYVLAMLAYEGVGWLVAELDGELVGLVCVLMQEARDVPIFVPRRFAAVETLVVAETSRRRGIGRALLDRAQQWAEAQGAESTELTVWEFNQGALQFYQSLGYETVRRKMSKRLR
jgi:ribosomal protein S18 acetylase RimI-like enzyme